MYLHDATPLVQKSFRRKNLVRSPIFWKTFSTVFARWGSRPAVVIFAGWAIEQQPFRPNRRSTNYKLKKAPLYIYIADKRMRVRLNWAKRL